MASKKKEYYKPGPMTEGKRSIIQGLLQEYNIESAADILEPIVKQYRLWANKRRNIRDIRRCLFPCVPRRIPSRLSD